jgi:hypothetical protein
MTFYVHIILVNDVDASSSAPPPQQKKNVHFERPVIKSECSEDDDMDFSSAFKMEIWLGRFVTKGYWGSK